jgi:hypothetical protein
LGLGIRDSESGLCFSLTPNPQSPDPQSLLLRPWASDAELRPNPLTPVPVPLLGIAVGKVVYTCIANENLTAVLRLGIAPCRGPNSEWARPETSF